MSEKVTAECLRRWADDAEHRGDHDCALDLGRAADAVAAAERERDTYGACLDVAATELSRLRDMEPVLLDALRYYASDECETPNVAHEAITRWSAASRRQG